MSAAEDRPDAPDAGSLAAAGPVADAAERPRLGGGYVRLLSASTLSNLGDGLMSVGVVWLASALTRDATVLALIGFASRLPWLLFALPAGVLADRFDRRRLVASMDVARSAVIFAFVLLLVIVPGGVPTPADLAAGTPPPSSAPLLLVGLGLLALLLGCAEVVRDNSAQTLLPAIVDKRLLEKANGRMWGAEVAMNSFVGPPLAGLLLAFAVVVPFAANAALLAASAVLVYSLSGNFARTGRSGPIAWRAEIAEGFRWLWSHTVLRALALLLGAMNMASALTLAVFVLYAQDVLGLFEGWQYGLLLTGMAAGAIAGSLVADRISDALGRGRSLLLAISVLGACFIVMGLVPVAVVVWLAAVVSGVAGVVWNVITVSLRQRIIPDELLGRVNSVYRFFGWGTISIGTLLGGLVVSLLEPGLGREWALRTPFLIAGAAHLAILGYAWRTIGRPGVVADASAAAPEAAPGQVQGSP